MLRKKISVCNTNIVINATFRTDLSLAYESFGYSASLINKTYNFYKCASYINADIQCYLNVDDVVIVQVEDYGESYAVIKGIFRHKSNDGYFFPFIYVDWFEDTHKNHDKLNCAIFALRYDDFYRKIFPLSHRQSSKSTFVHDCNTRCKNNHNLENRRYLKNDFFFKAI